MLGKIKQQRQEGFTIIEVMIVLVIAAVILLIVFLAVPALQRNSRNTQAKNEASALSAAVSEYISNNGGDVPTAASVSTTANSPAKAILDLANTKTITQFNVDLPAGSTAPSNTTAVVRLGSVCDAAIAKKTKPGSSRQTALVYQVEGSGSTTSISCIDSGV